MGAQQVKNIAEPVQAFRVRLDGAPARRMAPVSPRRALPWAAAVAAVLLLAGAAWFALRTPGPEPAVATGTKPSIAVLPFENLSGDETTNRLASGITEDLITDLSHIRKIDVIARNSTEVYKGQPIDVRSVGRDLNVRYVFEGSVQHEGDQIRVTAQLIDAATGVHVWSERWDRRAQDVFAVQTEIAEQIVAQMEQTYGPLNTPEIAAARRKRPENLTAYELNLLGVEKQLSPTRESIEESLHILNQAVKADPNFARAWINLAWAHAMRADYGGDWVVESQATLEAAERAARLDPNDAEAHSVLGHALGLKGDMGRAKAEFDSSLQLGPSSAGILTNYVGWASTFGEPELGAEMADRAIRLNPNYQPWASNVFRYAYFMAGRYKDALRVMERQTPENYTKQAWAERAGSLAALGRTAEAQATVKKALQQFPDLTVEGIANNPGFSATERQRYIDILPAAGIPLCATSEALAGVTNPVRLPECTAK
jgi:TolB-like protein